ncbi:MAG: hypothetical protein AMS24_02760 [Chlamydiae bacterium SM23_39]|nr:MAG: hypothetical protein AMS24_02760 [Chlamydiae bacterium SM23_39]
MLEIYFKSLKDTNFQKIKDYKIGSWINVSNATKEDLNKLVELTGIEITDIQDSLDKMEIPRIEQKNDNTLLFVRHPYEEEDLSTLTMTIILTKSYLITISPGKSKLTDSILSSKTPLATTQKSKLLLFLLLKITQDFTNKIKTVKYLVTDQTKKIRGISNKTIVLLTKLEEKLNQYLSSLVPMGIMLEAITSGRYISLYEKDQDLLQDLVIALKQSEDLCRINVKSIKSLRDAYQIIFTNDVNKTIKLLTAITIIFTIPTIIASIYGMNIKLPLATHLNAFSIIMAFTAISCIALTYIFIKKNWI